MQRKQLAATVKAQVYQPVNSVRYTKTIDRAAGSTD